MADVGHLLQGSGIDKEKLFNAGPQILTVLESRKVTFDDGQKVILSFEETEKTFTLNKTNLGYMITNHTRETDNWLGVKVMIHAQKLTSGKFAGSYTALLSKPMQQAVQPVQPQPVQQAQPVQPQPVQPQPVQPQPVQQAQPVQPQPVQPPTEDDQIPF